MAFKKTFVLSDESINTYGFWILLSGMDLSSVQANCPLYYEHRTWEIPLGHVENIRLKNGQVLGDVVIEGGNDMEREYIRKLQNNDIKGCSFGIDPVEWSEEPSLLKQGQTRATLTKCQPYELSLAPLPGNKNALALRNGNDMITLSASKNYDFIPDLNINENMKEVAILLGMDANSSAEKVCETLKALQLKAANAEAMQKIVEDTVSEGLEEPEKKFFLGLSKTNMQAALEFVNLKKAAIVLTAEPIEKEAPGKKDIKVSDLIQLGKNKETVVAEGKDSFDYLQKHNPVELARIRKEENEKYNELAQGYTNGVRYKA